MTRRPVRLLPAERALLEGLTRSRTQPHRCVIRSRIVLMAHEDASVAHIASAVGVARSTVRRWCRRFADGGVRVLLTEAPGRGRRPGIDRRVALAVLRAMRESAGTSTTIRALAARAGTSASRAWRILDRCGLRTSSSREAIDAAIGRVISETDIHR